jgi:hypothetical protein
MNTTPWRFDWSAPEITLARVSGLNRLKERKRIVLVIGASTRMAQGFKRTGSVFSARQTKTASSSVSKHSQVSRKGARAIQPKKATAVRAVQLQKQLTAQLNRRAEAALILQSGTEATALTVVRGDARALQELRAKQAKRHGQKKEGDEQANGGKGKTGESTGIEAEKKHGNALTQAALDALNNSGMDSDEAGDELE